MINAKFILLMALWCLPLLLSCRSAGLNQDAGASSATAPYLYFRKTPCLGTCPSYEAAIATNGEVRYVGWEHVQVKDTAYFKLPEQDLQQLQRLVQAVNYQKLPAEFSTQWSDMPSTHLHFFEKGKRVKEVVHEEGGPPELNQLQDWLHKKLMELALKQQSR